MLDTRLNQICFIFFAPDNILRPTECRLQNISKWFRFNNLF